VEQRFARWTVGAEAAVVGFPQTIEFEECKPEYVGGRIEPKGYTKASAKSPDADSTYRTYHTYLDWDYNRYPYDGADGSIGGKYGPSSNHPGLVFHSLLDGSVRGYSREVDIALYMYLIRRERVEHLSDD
jgi:hypothetical protein